MTQSLLTARELAAILKYTEASARAALKMAGGIK